MNKTQQVDEEFWKQGLKSRYQLKVYCISIDNSATSYSTYQSFFKFFFKIIIKIILT